MEFGRILHLRIRIISWFEGAKKKSVQATRGAAMVLVILWTTREDTRKLEPSSAPLSRALATPHLWNPALDNHEFLGFFRKWRSPEQKRGTKLSKSGRDLPRRTAAFAHTLDWLAGRRAPPPLCNESLR